LYLARVEEKYKELLSNLLNEKSANGKGRVASEDELTKKANELLSRAYGLNRKSINTSRLLEMKFEAKNKRPPIADDAKSVGESMSSENSSKSSVETNVEKSNNNKSSQSQTQESK
jgi:hypothetical protein